MNHEEYIMIMVMIATTIIIMTWNSKRQWEGQVYVIIVMSTNSGTITVPNAAA